MRKRITKFIVMLLVTTMMVTSLPTNLLEAQAAGVNAEGANSAVKVTVYAEDDSEDNSVSDSDADGTPQLFTEDGDSTTDGTNSTGEVTRAEWLSRLADTFAMTVEEDYYPDNYFSDLDSSSEYYYDVLLNVEFGVIDVETGGEVRPEDPVTREFAAHTLNYCLGYQPDESMVASCSDIDDSE